MPQSLQGCDIVHLQLEIGSLGDQHLRVGGRHLLETRQVEVIGALGAGEDLILIPADKTPSILVLPEGDRQARPQRELDSLDFELGALQLRPCCLYVALVAVKDGYLHA
ncbi:hypothetical protein MYX77_10405, partial [Acidobacteriia bacterium AH_259_A11_L15]|nr:hypothetical protein [Acidobacteriia bacterium AH_259_A11_L15]